MKHPRGSIADEVDPATKKAKVSKRALDHMWETGLWVCHKEFEEFLVSAMGSKAFASAVVHIEQEDKEDEDEEAMSEYSATKKALDSDSKAA